MTRMVARTLTTALVVGWLGGCAGSSSDPSSLLGETADGARQQAATANAATANMTTAAEAPKASAAKKPAAGAVAAATPGARVATQPLVWDPSGAAPNADQRQALLSRAAVAAPGNTGYKIGQGDIFDFTVFKVPEMAKTLAVSEAGTASFPLVGDIMMAGRTAREVEQELEQKLGGKYLQSPQVSVLVKEFNSQRITIEGAVKKPGVLPLKGETSLLQAIALAEGIDAQVASTVVVVLRTENGQRKAARFDLDEIRAGTTTDPKLRGGDMVIVDTSSAKTTLNNLLKVIPLASLFVLL